MSDKPLMPKATAVWLIDNTSLTFEQIEKNPELKLKMAPAKYKMPHIKAKKTPRYTPVSKRQDKPDAIYWLLRNHAELTDADIMKLIGTTKATIAKIRDRGHWNSQNIKAVDPVTLGLCSQIELDFIVGRAAHRKPRPTKKSTESMKTVEETTAGLTPAGEENGD